MLSSLLATLALGPPILAIRDVTVIDCTGGPPKPSQTVIVVANRIRDVKPSGSAKIPSDARVIEGKGST